ncbi:MAG: hypothetical protein ABIK28_08530, partial [Planctomycetota bacterium]
IYKDSHGLNYVPNNIDADPLFINPDLKHFHLSQAPCQIATSPCVNAGCTYTELLGTTRTDGELDDPTDDMGYHYADGLSLYADQYSISGGTGGSVHFTLDAGYAKKHKWYWILGSLSGTEPGMNLPGGIRLPVNFDNFTWITIMMNNSCYFSAFLGKLDAEGIAAAKLKLPAVPCLTGETLSFAYFLPWPGHFASNAAQIGIIE